MNISFFTEYIKTVEKTGFLGPEEEKELFCKAIKGNSKSIEKIAEAYQHLVLSIAFSFKQNKEKTFELVQEGNIGLLESLKKYNPNTGTAFSIFAKPRIKGTMIDFLKKESEKEEIYSLETPVSENSTLADILKDEHTTVSELIEIHLKQELIKEKIQEAIEKLPAKEKTVIEMIHIKMKDRKEVAKEMGLTTSSIYRHEKKAIQRIRGRLSKVIKKIRSA